MSDAPNPLRLLIPVWLLVLPAVAAPTAAWAQPGVTAAMPAGGGVYASGTGEVSRRAERVRLTVWLEAKAGEMSEALDRLRRREQRALAKLKQLNADPDSINLGPAELPGGVSARQQQMMQMYGAQPGGRRGGRALKMPKMAVVRKKLTAEWALPTAEGDAYLLACHKLTTAISSADIADASNPDPVPPEVAEVMEELAEMPLQYGVEPDEASAGPRLVYYFKVTEQEHAQAMAAAFAEARSRAAEMAAPTGGELGPVSAVSKSVNPYQMAQFYGSFGQPQPADVGRLEAASDRPGEATHRVEINVTFELSRGE